MPAAPRNSRTLDARMKVEDSIMANEIAVANHEDQPSGIERATAGPERLMQFLRDVRQEMRKVITPTRAEVQSTTIVVIVTVFIFAAFFEAVDMLLGHSIDKIFAALIK
jgi:preprotein translocase subunit SecE